MNDCLKVRRSPGSRLPVRAHPGDLGYDLSSLQQHYIKPGERKLIETGLVVEFPEGFGGVIQDRSSLAVKGLHVLAGVIDNGYHGEIKVLLYNLGSEPVEINAGERIAQLIPTPVVTWEITEDRNIDIGAGRGTNGFGSTGSH